jgi:hypothetical protein
VHALEVPCVDLYDKLSECETNGSYLIEIALELPLVFANRFERFYHRLIDVRLEECETVVLRRDDHKRKAVTRGHNLIIITARRDNKVKMAYRYS